jgi:hypothetical protein
MATRKRANYIRRLSLTLSTDWSQVYELDAIDTFSLKVTGDNVEARFSPPAPSQGAYDWRDELACRGGETTSASDSEFGAYGAVQLRIAPGGSSSTVDLYLNCKG